MIACNLMYFWVSKRVDQSFYAKRRRRRQQQQQRPFTDLSVSTDVVKYTKN